MSRRPRMGPVWVAVAVAVVAVVSLAVARSSDDGSKAIPSTSGAWPNPGAGAKPAAALPIEGEIRVVEPLRRPLVLGGAATASELSVPAAQAAPAADPAQAPPGSLTGTERTLTIRSGSAAQIWRIRLDVIGVVPIGSGMISIQTEAKVISGPPGETFRNYNTLFTGGDDDGTGETAIYDRSAKTSLPVVTDSAGDPLRSDHNIYIDPGGSVTDWEIYPRPDDMASGTIQYYLPGLGVLTVPVNG